MLSSFNEFPKTETEGRSIERSLHFLLEWHVFLSSFWRDEHEIHILFVFVYWHFKDLRGFLAPSVFHSKRERKEAIASPAIHRTTAYQLQLNHLYCWFKTHVYQTKILMYCSFLFHVHQERMDIFFPPCQSQIFLLLSGIGFCIFLGYL